MKRILFLCSQNKLRSTTAEKVFSEYPDLEVASAGLDTDAKIKVTKELVDWADLIFVMEKNHKNRLQKEFKQYLANKKVVCLNIPDNYDYMDQELVQIFKDRIPGIIKVLSV